MTSIHLWTSFSLNSSQETFKVKTQNDKCDTNQGINQHLRRFGQLWTKSLIGGPSELTSRRQHVNTSEEPHYKKGVMGAARSIFYCRGEKSTPPSGHLNTRTGYRQ